MKTVFATNVSRFDKDLISFASFALSATATAVALLLPYSVSAAPANKDKKFMIERVTFQSGGDTIVGNLYIPAGVSASKPGNAAVVTGAWMTIKEQMAGRYAEELAERGVVALAFDFRTWGESGGKQRAMENPAMKTDDIKAAATYLQTRREVNRNGIGALGICASAAYAANAAVRSSAISSVALVAPWLHDKAIVNAVYGGEESVQKLIATGRDAQAKYAASGALTLVPAASTTDKSAVMFGAPYYTETHRGMIAKWENKFNLASWEGWLTLDAMVNAPKLTKPLLMVHSEAAAIPQGAKQFFAATATTNKQKVLLDNVTQFDFYDGEAAVNRAADAVATHFKTSFAAS
jgi:uncharacterized protein